jgi:hypothetical protein
MKIFLLPGQSIRNKEWIEDVDKEFKKVFPNTEIIYYEHWSLGKKEANIDLETERFVELVNNCNEDYIVFAKSLGTLIFLNSVKLLKKKPKGVLMVGFAYYFANRLDLDVEGLIGGADFRIDIYQKEFDTAGKYEELKGFSNEYVSISKYKCTGEGNDDHHYANLEYMLELLRDLLI